MNIYITIIVIVLLRASAHAAPINTYELSNGMRIIHKRNPANDVVAIDVFIKGGLREEPGTKAGIAMLSQSLLSKGTRSRSAEQIALEIESCGGKISASVSEDFLLAHALVTIDSIRKGFELLSDIIINPVFPEDEFQKEKKAQINAIRTRHERIFTAAHDALLSHLYPHHSYGRPLTGEEDTLEKLIRTDVVEWYRNNVYPQRTLLVVVGNCTLDDIVALSKEYFSIWKDTVEQRPLVMPVVVELIKKNISRTITMDFKQSFIMLGYLVPSGISDDYETLKLINEILGGGMSRRLFQKFREEKPYAYSVGSFYPTRVETSSFVLYMGLDKDNIDDAKEEFMQILKDLQEKPVSENELEESKTHLTGTYRMAHQSNQSQAWYLGWWEIVGRGYAYDETYPDEIQRIITDDIQRVALEYFNSGRVLITIKGR